MQGCTRLISYGVVMMLVSLLTGCGGKQGSGENEASNAENVDSVREQVLKTLRESGISNQFSLSASGFQPEALHDISKIHDYLKNSNKAFVALQLGVYMSDLGYLVNFGKSEEAKRYFEACVLLANDAGLNKQFSHAVELKFRVIISGNEALEKSLDRLYKYADNSSDDFKKAHAAALTGYYIEELYHLVVFAEAPSPSDTLSNQMKLKALQTLVGQNDEVNNLIGYFDHLQLKPEGIALYQEFLGLQSRYIALDANRLLSGSDPAVMMQDPGFAEVTRMIKTIRNIITGG